MSDQNMGFLIEEYLKLWEHHGIHSLIHTGRNQLMDQITSNHTESTQPQPTTPPLDTLESIQSWIGVCERCRLCEQRNKIVFGDGDPAAKLMFVGEGPGADEDAQGLPFVGRAGKLLNKIIEAMGYQRKDVYIGNVVKCRPPKNRTPLPDEVETCTPFLQAQIEVIKPKIIVALGLPSANYLLQKAATMSSMRGKFHKLHWQPSVLVMPTYHPAYLLRNPSAKKIVWEDMKLVMAKLGKIH